MHNKAYALLALTALFWGGNAIAGKLAVGHVSPMLLTTLRWGLAMAALAVIGWPRLRADWSKVRKRLIYLTALGALGFTVFNTSIEQAGMPMVIFAANFLLFRMRITWAQIVGFILSLAGVAVTASHGEARIAAAPPAPVSALIAISETPNMIPAAAPRKTPWCS